MPHRHSQGQPAGSYGYSCHRRCILLGSHLANILLAMSQNAEGGYCIVAKVVASALDVVGGMTWRKPTRVLYNGASSSLRGDRSRYKSRGWSHARRGQMGNPRAPGLQFGVSSFISRSMDILRRQPDSTPILTSRNAKSQ